GRQPRGLRRDARDPPETAGPHDDPALPALREGEDRRREQDRLGRGKARRCGIQGRDPRRRRLREGSPGELRDRDPDAARARQAAGRRQRGARRRGCDLTDDLRRLLRRQAQAVTRSRLEAFSDGVIAILITIMVLELKVPSGARLADLSPGRGGFLTYGLSFIFLGIFWNNHHHMLHMVDRIDGRILWANLHLLFWLSLIPFATAWLGRTGITTVPTAIYGGVFLASALAWILLQAAIIALQGPDSKLKAAIQSDWKGKISIAAYAAAVVLAFYEPRISIALYVAVALLWLRPRPPLSSSPARGFSSP